VRSPIAISRALQYQSIDGCKTQHAFWRNGTEGPFAPTRGDALNLAVLSAGMFILLKKIPGWVS
jgi:hypothetical protein